MPPGRTTAGVTEMKSKILASDLRAEKACESEVKRFEREWPDGAELTLENCQKAAEMDFDLGWFSLWFLSPKARKVYLKAVAPAIEVYAWKVHALAVACEDYLDIDIAWKVYKKASAIALWQAIQSEKGD